MCAISLCLELNLIEYSYADNHSLEKVYQAHLKGLLQFLYKHPKLNFTFGFTGAQIEFLSQKHPEAIELLSDLTSRHQVELLGGGYYAPIFPVLFPVDRSGQIEKMTSILRATVGKRPRGLSLFGNIWEPSLLPTIQSCGIEYIHLDSLLIPPVYKKYMPLIISDQGKNLKVLPVYSDFCVSKDETGEAWLKRIKLSADKQKITAQSPVITVSYNAQTVEAFLSKEHLAFLDSYMAKTDEPQDFVFSTPQQFLKSAEMYLPSYIPAGMHPVISQWVKQAYKSNPPQGSFPLTIHDFLNTYQQNRHLYERMSYISLLISQCHGGDKIRKRCAQETLWEAQSGVYYVDLPLGGPAVVEHRQKSYRLLNEAERVIRQSRPFAESLTSFDYNGDGRNEYVCKMEKFHSVVELKGGQISELNIINGGANYAASLSRINDFDGAEDNYDRGFFVDHLMEASDLVNYLELKPIGSSVFSQVLFSEKKFDSRRKEIQLEGHGNYSSLKMPVSLRKNYIVSSNGFIVQYILKNESPFPLKGVFLVEINMAQTNFTQNEQSAPYVCELIMDGNRAQVPLSKQFHAPNGVSLLQMTDSVDKTSFLFEPNEESGFITAAIPFKRPCSESADRQIASTQVAAFYWNVDLAVDRAMEKTINFSIIPAKKRSRQ